MKKKILLIITVVCVFADIYYSFTQHYNAELDGDMPESVLPLPYIRPVFADPFGIKTIVNNNPHAGPNRFFSHWLENRWFNTVPFALQKVSDPIHSVYIAQGLYKTIIQILLIYLLAVFTFGTFKPFTEWKHWLVILFYCSLFQSCGKVRSMGIIDPSVTYTFFYAMPLLFLILYLLPFIFEEFYNKKIFRHKITYIIWSIIFVLLSCFSGPTNTGTALVFIAVIMIRYLVNYTKSNKQTSYFKDFFVAMPKRYYCYLLPLAVISLYSLFLGTYNSMYSDPIPLKDRFLLLPMGMFQYFINNFGMSVLTVGCIINTILLIRTHDKQNKRTASLFGWILLFSFIYILLLPFGGYRPYRPYIIRYDTVVCISYLFIFYEVYSTSVLFQRALNTKKVRMVYTIFTILFAGYFFVIDNPASWRSKAEKHFMYELAKTNDDTYIMDWEFTVISWDVPKEAWQSANAVECMKRWNIIDKDKKIQFYYLPK